jgi:hypothetical protein
VAFDVTAPELPVPHTQDGAIAMKTVLSGVALSAILALAIPAWAQAPNTDASQPPSTQASTPQAKKAPAHQGMHARKVSHRSSARTAMHHRAKGHYATHARSMHRTTTARLGGTAPTDNVANQLNRSEAQRLSGGSTPPTGATNMAPMGNSNMAPMGNNNMAPMGAPNQARPIQGQ